MTAEWSELATYLAGELAADEEEAFERELFQTGEPASVGLFLGLTDGIAGLHRAVGGLSPVLGRDALAALRERERLFELDLTEGEVAECFIPEDAAFAVAHVRVDTADAAVIDLEMVNGAGETYMRFRDVAVDRSSGEAFIACERHMTLREEVTVFRFVTKGRAGRRVLGDYGVKNVPPPS